MDCKECGQSSNVEICTCGTPICNNCGRIHFGLEDIPNYKAWIKEIKEMERDE